MTGHDESPRRAAQGMNSTQTISTYEGILAITEQMLKAAQNSNWDELVSLEHDCKQLTNQLIEQHSQQKLTEEQQKKKITLIQQILARDAEIRTITEPWVALLQNLLTTHDQKRKLQHTYRSDQ
jgi:flagellar protein FliT